MTTVETTFIVIIILLGLVMIVSIWWAVFTRKIKKLENNISERLQVTDIVLASKKEFLRKLAEQLNNKTLKAVSYTHLHQRLIEAHHIWLDI